MTATTTTFPVSTDLAAGTRAIVVITASGKRFSEAVSYVKRLGGQFDSIGKVWIVRITESNAGAARHLVSEHGNFTGYQVIDNAAWVARRKANEGR